MNSNFQKANNPQELLDLVDEHDQIIGEVVRSKANADPNLCHREVGVLIVNREQKILLEKRSKYKIVNPSSWSIPAGHIPKGGKPEEVSHQELIEEVGFDVELQFIEKKLRKYSNESHFMYYFIGKYSGQKIIIQPAEVEKVGFFSRQDIELMRSEGESINQHHFDMFEKIWNREIDLS